MPRLHAGDDVDRRHGSLLSGAKFPSACEQLVGLSSVPKACRQLHTSGPVSARRRQCGSAQISRLGSPAGQSESLACGQSARGWHSVGTHTGCRSSSAGAAQPGHGRIRPGKAPSIQQRPASALGATREKPSSRCAWKPQLEARPGVSCILLDRAAHSSDFGNTGVGAHPNALSPASDFTSADQKPVGPVRHEARSHVSRRAAGSSAPAGCWRPRCR